MRDEICLYLLLKFLNLAVHGLQIVDSGIAKEFNKNKKKYLVTISNKLTQINYVKER